MLGYVFDDVFKIVISSLTRNGTSIGDTKVPYLGRPGARSREL